jgi:hypothetical protein
LVIQLFGYSAIRLFGYSVIRLFGYLVIQLFGYSVIRLFGYLVIWLFGYSVIRLFGSTEYPNNQIIWLFLRLFGSPELTRMHPNLAIIAQNRWGASPKNGISLEGIIIFLEKILAKTPNPKLL